MVSAVGGGLCPPPSLKIYFSLKSGARICRAQGVCACNSGRIHRASKAESRKKARVAKGQRHIALTFPVLGLRVSLFDLGLVSHGDQRKVGRPALSFLVPDLSPK